MARFRIGTSGFDYDAWKGVFYPAELPRKQRLSWYAGKLGALEINASFYRKPSPETVRGWATQVPGEFRFALKAWQRITHQKRLRDCGELLSVFAAAARELGERAGPILYQLPPNLKKDLPLLREFLSLLPPGLRAAFEFRNASWFDDEVFAALGAAGCALCVAETEEATVPLVRTAPFGYFRLRREDYDASRLARWAEEIARAGFTEDVFVFFKHEDEARGPAFALQFEPLAQAAVPAPG
ncbi:MAG TPA: DUF72 domain-containing protein [Myxococcales bacterium]|nr:DUF72 domain-containing protein [Myxococcales bacterium]